MIIVDLHPLELSTQDCIKTTQNEILQTLIKQSSRRTRNILIRGTRNRCLSRVLQTKANGLIHSAYQNNKHAIRRRNCFDIFLKLVDISSFAGLFIQTLLGKCYVTGDKIFLRSARAWEFHVKFIAVLRNKEIREQTLDLLMDVAIACYIAAITNINIYAGLKNTATSITETAATNTATLGIETAAQVVGNAVAGAAISAIVDVAVSSATIYVAKRQKDEGRISEKEFSIKIKKTVCESSCKFVGGTTGSILGQALIPVPVVGAFVGGFCGSLIGAGIGKSINYGVFDRKSKKMPTSDNKAKNEQNIRKIYGRRIRGYIPKVTIYNENTRQFEEKHFQKTIKNYFKPIENSQLMLNETQAKVSEAVTMKPYLNKWRRRTSGGECPKPNSTTSFVQQSPAEKQLSVLSKWKMFGAKTPEAEANIAIGKESDQNDQDSKHSVSEAPDSDFSPVFLGSNSPTHRECYKDRLSPNHLFKQMKNNIMSKSTNKKDEEKLCDCTENESQLSAILPESGSTSPRSDTKIFNRLSIKSLKDSFQSIGRTASPTKLESPEKSSFFPQVDESDENDYEEEEEQQTESHGFTATSLSRIRSFHSSMKDRNREKMKFPSIQKMSFFSSSINDEENVSNDDKDSSPVKSRSHSSSDRRNSKEPTGDIKAINSEKSGESMTQQEERNGEFLSSLTSKLFSFTGVRRKSSSSSTFEDELPVRQKQHNSNSMNVSAGSSFEESPSAPNTPRQNKKHQIRAKHFRSSLSSSFSENSSSCSSPLSSGMTGNENSEPTFSEREFDWWNKKLRQQFDNRANHHEELNKQIVVNDEGLDKQSKKRSDSDNNTNDNGNDEEHYTRSNMKKNKKLLSSFKNFTKKFK